MRIGPLTTTVVIRNMTDTQYQRALADKSKSPPVDSTAFLTVSPDLLWSANLVQGSANNAWYVDMRDGSVDYGSGIFNDNRVRCVR